MRHGDKQNNLGRKKAHREALLSNLASSLIVHKRIVTTLAKAKALRTYIEPLITKTKKGDSKETISHQHRIVFSYLQDKTATKELFTVVAPKIAARPGGYTRIIKLGIRPGDNAEKAMIELVDFNEIYGKGIGTVKAEGAKKTRRSRGGKKADSTEGVKASVAAPKAEKVAEVTTSKTGDDLVIIEGIGPKAAEVLNAAGITTFTQLAEMPAEKVKEILENANARVGHLDPTTWAKQAQLAAEGKMDELKSLQDELKGGKEVE